MRDDEGAQVSEISGAQVRDWPPRTSRPRQAKRPQHYARDDFCWDMLGQVPETAAGSEFEDSESSWDEAGARRVSLG